jgi:hypothetical protein
MYILQIQSSPAVYSRRAKYKKSITVAGQRRADAIGFDLVAHHRTAQISLALMAFPRG